jgi:hypothetical protein
LLLVEKKLLSKDLSNLFLFVTSWSLLRNAPCYQYAWLYC